MIAELNGLLTGGEELFGALGHLAAFVERHPARRMCLNPHVIGSVLGVDDGGGQANREAGMVVNGQKRLVHGTTVLDSHRPDRTRIT